MSYTIKIFCRTAMVFVCATNLFSQTGSYVGTSSANFLKIGLGAKAVGMGESYITESEDASALYWNPGAITRIGHPSAAFSSLQWLVGTNVSYAAAVLPTDFGTLGIDLSYFGSGDIEETTLEQQDGTGRVVTANDMAIGFTYARDLTDRFSVGLKIKYVREQLATVNADAFAFDVGSVFSTPFLGGMKIGMLLSNFGGSMRFDGNDLVVTHIVPGSPTGKQIPAEIQTTDWELPLFFRAGLATDILTTDVAKVTTSYTITDSRDFSDRHAIGAACTFVNLLTLRGGYRFKYDEATYSLGGGVQFTSAQAGKFFVDYSYTDFGRIGGIHQVSVSVNLN